MKDKKVFGGRLEFKADGEPGSFRAVFATLNVVDHDGDITKPGAFKEGQAVRISAWNHGWGELPVGRGTIHANQVEAWVEGKFFLETDAGKEHYETIKLLDELVEWSYGFRILKWSYQRPESPEGNTVRILEEMDVIEVSPVMQAAGIGTHTVDMKEGRRNNARDLEDIQAVHDAAARLGANCGGDNATGDEDAPKGQQPSKVTPRDIQRRIEIDTILLS